MQIRKRGQRIEFLRAYYNKDKGRSDQKMIGAYQKYGTTEVPQELLDKMDEKEQAQAKDHLKTMLEEDESMYARFRVSCCDQRIEELVAALERYPDQVTKLMAINMYRSMDNIAKILRRTGFVKSRVLKDL